MLNRLHCSVIGFAACTLFALGCGNSDTAPVASPPPISQPEQGGHDHSSQDHGDHAGHDHGNHDHSEHAHGGDSDIAKALASLSAEDRAAVEKQKICPVTDEPLGSMGAPMKVSVKGRDVFICCEGCTDALNDEPDTFLAKLPQ